MNAITKPKDPSEMTALEFVKAKRQSEMLPAPVELVECYVAPNGMLLVPEYVTAKGASTRYVAPGGIKYTAGYLESIGSTKGTEMLWPRASGV